MEIVSMMNIQIPTSHVRYAHVVTTKFCGLYIPNHVLTITILIAHFHYSSSDSIHSLSVDVQSVPGVRELDYGIGFEHFFEEDAFNCNS